jgi:ubiquinol-cytochrome c reductase iron-sulfur subunit
MATLIPSSNPVAIGRRRFLYVVTGLVGAAGVTAAAWPFTAQMNPDASTRAPGDVVDVDLHALRPAQRVAVRWRGYPIFVVRRTDGMLSAMQEATFLAQLVDANSEKRQQPAYAKNWHRSIDPAYAILIGVCTRCGCVPDYLEADSPFGMTGGYICPCCASHYDPAGRAYDGPAAYNLPVPPHAIEKNAHVLIGKARPGELFSLETVERI